MAMHFTPTSLTWIRDAYTLVFGGLLLLGARSGDIVGRRRMFLISLVIVGLASLLVGLAPYIWWLIAARAFQGTGAAILAPSSLSLLTCTAPELAHCGDLAFRRSRQAARWYSLITPGSRRRRRTGPWIGITTVGSWLGGNCWRP